MPMGAEVLVGVVYGTSSVGEYACAVRDPTLKRLDYVAARTEDGEDVLGRVVAVERRSSLSLDEALAVAEIRATNPRRRGTEPAADEASTARVRILGYRDERGLLQLPGVPLPAGAEVRRAPESLVGRVLGLEDDGEGGAYLGFLKGTRLAVHLRINTLVQRHVCVLAKTGAGKSYTVGVLIEELLKKRVPLVIVDPHNEYASLANPNIETKEIDAMIRFAVKPKGFQRQLVTWATPANPAPGTRALRLEGTDLDASEILALVGDQLTGAQVGVLYQALKEAKERKPAYTLRDVINAAHANRSATKWNVINALEGLDSTGLFSTESVPMPEVVKEGQCSILSLKGVAPHLQEIVVARLANELFEARKSGKVPPFLLVLEEAHNWCPERGVGNAVSGTVIRTIASEGRKFGLGLLIVSQRPAKVDKNVVSQCNTQLILKVTNPNDLKAIVASVEGLTPDASEEIQGLPIGVALVSGGDLSVPVLVEVRTRQSRHGGRSVAVLGAEAQEVAEVPPELAADPEPPQAAPEPAEEPMEEEPLPLLAPEATIASGSQFVEVVEAPAPVSQAPPPAPPQPVEFIEMAPRPPARPFPVAPTRPVERPLAKPRAPLPPSLEADEAAAHRVAQRMGFVRSRDPAAALDRLSQAVALLPGVSPEKYIATLARIGRLHCLPAAPRCAACPLAAKCEYKRGLDAAQPRRGLLRRLLRR